jgi:hypothetical protein
MGLFAGRPPGVQIKRWLIILVVSIVALDCLAAASLLTLQRSMIRIHGSYQPVLISAGEISTLVHQAQSSLYKYLGEFLPTTAEALGRAAELEKTIGEALSQEAGGTWSADLQAIRGSLEKYRVVLKSLPPISDRTKWDQAEELRTQANELGVAMERTADKLKADAVAKIGEQAAAALRLSSLAVYLFFGFLVLSLVITVLLFFWWKQFQEMILNL